MSSTKFDGGPLVGACNPDEKSVQLNFWPVKVLFLVASHCIVSVHDEIDDVCGVLCVCRCDRPLRCQCRYLFSALLCRDVLSARCDACRELGVGRALFLKRLGRVDVQSGVLKGNEEEESKPSCVAACFPLTHVTRAAHPNEGYFDKHPSPGIQLQCFRQILH